MKLYSMQMKLMIYIKRIIGVPGDTIEYRNDVLYVNGQKVERAILSSKN